MDSICSTYTQIKLRGIPTSHMTPLSKKARKRLSPHARRAEKTTTMNMRRAILMDSTRTTSAARSRESQEVMPNSCTRGRASRVMARAEIRERMAARPEK